MIYTIVISSVNYSGETADITFLPYTGGTVNIGLQTLPYNFTTFNTTIPNTLDVTWQFDATDPSTYVYTDYLVLNKVY
jgi:hypothetical protein